MPTAFHECCNCRKAFCVEWRHLAKDHALVTIAAIRTETAMNIYRLVLLLIVGIYLFSPALMDAWLDPHGAWYRPYLLWLILILISMALQNRRDASEL
jgi:hypothetical protein